MCVANAFPVYFPVIGMHATGGSDQIGIPSIANTATRCPPPSILVSTSVCFPVSPSPSPFLPIVPSHISFPASSAIGMSVHLCARLIGAFSSVAGVTGVPPTRIIAIVAFVLVLTVLTSFFEVSSTLVLCHHTITRSRTLHFVRCS